MIGSYLNQTAVWHSKTGSDPYEGDTYGPDALIKVRWEGNRKLVRNAQGEETVSEALVITKAAVQADDVLTFDGRDWTAISVLVATNLDGSESHREVRL